MIFQAVPSRPELSSTSPSRVCTPPTGPSRRVNDNRHSNRGRSMTYLEGGISCRLQRMRKRFIVGPVVVLNNPPAEAKSGRCGIRAGALALLAARRPGPGPGVQLVELGRGKLVLRRDGQERAVQRELELGPDRICGDTSRGDTWGTTRNVELVSSASSSCSPNSSPSLSTPPSYSQV